MYLCEFENSQGYKEKLCLRTTKTKRKKENNLKEKCKVIFSILIEEYQSLEGNCPDRATVHEEKLNNGAEVLMP